jgi:glycosyltransferase involved in cell wall biosynthesis
MPQTRVRVMATCTRHSPLSQDHSMPASRTMTGLKVDNRHKLAPRVQSNQISVTLSVGSGLYQKRLATSLLRIGMLRRVLRFGPDMEVLDPDGSESLTPVKQFRFYKLANRLIWAGWSRLPSTGRSRLPIVATSWLADRLASRWVPESSIFHGWTSVCLASLHAAKRQRAITLVENPMLHPRGWQREVLAECKRFSVSPRDCDAVLSVPQIQRREREYEVCDRIVVNSTVAHRSFEEFGHADKTVVVQPGVDHVFFAPAAEPASPQLFRVCYAGRVELAKGVVYLLHAWKRLALPHAELLLIGEIRPEMKPLLNGYADATVRLPGFVAPEELAEIYRQSSVFAFPSVNEGLALVMLEAMASGIAVIATDKSGGEDCITEGNDGFVIPARSVDAIAEAILWCYRNRDELMEMGKAARKKVEKQFTLAAYEERQIDLYRSLVAARDPVVTNHSNRPL